LLSTRNIIFKMRNIVSDLSGDASVNFERIVVGEI
jgi:hypothetical protein